MKKVKIEITEVSENGIQAVAFLDEKPIDSHFHSSEYWLLHDWGFTEGKAFDGQEQDYGHDKNLREVVGETFILQYKDKTREVIFN